MKPGPFTLCQVIQQILRLPLIPASTADDSSNAPDAATRDYCPVPLSAIVCGEPGASSLIVTSAVTAPVFFGAKWP